MALSIPTRLRSILQGTEHEGAVLTFLDSIEPILRDNKTPFFPAYTDHGTQHIERVFRSAEDLVHEDVWGSGLVKPADVATLLCAAVLHDVAMHLREPGFVELVTGRAERFAPLAWWRDRHERRSGDRPWADIWSEFQKEAVRMSATQMESILGAGRSVAPDVVRDVQLEPADWKDDDRLIVGEFVRRHHARLAHEIVFFGLPGSDVRETRPLVELAPTIADVAGAVARSHNENLRTAASYLDYRDPGSLRNGGALGVFWMAVLRIADYLQLDSDRAPVVLLRLKAPKSAISISEWGKHGSVVAISWQHENPLGVYFELSAGQAVRTYTGMVNLLADIQAEMDHCVAVLGERYSIGGFESLRLSRSRVYSNATSKSLIDALPYYPAEARIRSSPDLFRLVVADLYGSAPLVAGRELLQNAIDSVRTRRLATPQADSFEANVTVEWRRPGADEQYETLVVSDNGIGMLPDTVIDFFLTAGASMKVAQRLSQVGTESEALAGHFGIGVFACFLLGSEFSVTTRHKDAPIGIEFTVDELGEPLELRWCEAPIGTEVRVRIDHVLKERRIGQRVSVETSDYLNRLSDLYVHDWPHVTYVRSKGDRVLDETVEVGTVPSRPTGELGPWRDVEVEGFDSVLWSIPRVPTNLGLFSNRERINGELIINGFRVTDSSTASGGVDGYELSLEASREIRSPRVSVVDSSNRLGMRLTRYGLSESGLPFEDALLESVGKDLLAYSLVMGPKQYPLARGTNFSPVVGHTGWVPLERSLLHQYGPDVLIAVWSDDGSSDPAISQLLLPQVQNSPEKEMFVLLPGLGRVGVDQAGIADGHTFLQSSSVPIGRRETRTLEELLMGRGRSARMLDARSGYEMTALVTSARDVEKLKTKSTYDKISVPDGDGADPMSTSTWRLLDQQDGIVFYGFSSDDPARPNDLLNRSLAVVKRLGNGARGMGEGRCGVSVHRRVEGASARPAGGFGITSAWHSLLGGTLPLDPDLVARRSKELSASDVKLGRMVGAWREQQRP